MRMAEDELVTQAVAYIRYVESTFLAANLGVKAHMQQHISQFLADVVGVVAKQCIAQFKGLLDCIGTQALVGLLVVPRTFLAQFVEHIQQTAKRLHFFFFRMHFLLYIFFVFPCSGRWSYSLFSLIMIPFRILPE